MIIKPESILSLSFALFCLRDKADHAYWHWTFLRFWVVKTVDLTTQSNFDLCSKNLTDVVSLNILLLKSGTYIGTKN